MNKIILFIIGLAVSLSTFGQTERKYSTYYYQRASLFEQLPTSSDDILFIGNSITDGGEWSELFQNPHVKNRGISGDTTWGVYDRISVLLKGKPAQIFLMIGINNVPQGEGIYNTRPWKKNCQWSEGKRDWKSGEKYYVSGNAILKQTVNPEPGYATQEVFFTCKANNLYAILTNYPDKITLKDVKSTSHTIINLLGYPDKLRWEQKGQNLIVYLPQITFLKMPCKYAWTLKITNIQ